MVFAFLLIVRVQGCHLMYLPESAFNFRFFDVFIVCIFLVLDLFLFLFGRMSYFIPFPSFPRPQAVLYSSRERDMTSRREPWERGCLPGIPFSEHTIKRGRGLGEEFHTNR